MTVNRALEQLLEIEMNKKGRAYNEDTLCVGLARVGHDDQRIITGPMKELLHADFGPPLHAVVIPGELHFMEKEHIETFSINQEKININLII